MRKIPKSNQKTNVRHPDSDRWTSCQHFSPDGASTLASSECSHVLLCRHQLSAFLLIIQSPLPTKLVLRHRFRTTTSSHQHICKLLYHIVHASRTCLLYPPNPVMTMAISSFVATVPFLPIFGRISWTVYALPAPELNGETVA